MFLCQMLWKVYKPHSFVCWDSIQMGIFCHSEQCFFINAINTAVRITSGTVWSSHSFEVFWNNVCSTVALDYLLPSVEMSAL